MLREFNSVRGPGPSTSSRLVGGKRLSNPHVGAPAQRTGLYTAVTV